MSKKKPATPPSFEESLEQLEAIVGKLEGGQLPLDDSLKQYELGIRHLGLCYKTLSCVEKKIELLSGIDAQGKLLREPFGDLESVDELGSVDDLGGDQGKISSKKKALSSVTKGTARSRRSSSPARKKPSASSSQSNVDEGDTLF